MMSGTGAATSEDIAMSTRWLLERMERDQDERREWRACDELNYKEANGKHNAATNRVAHYMLYRGMIETLILLVLMWSVFL